MIYYVQAPEYISGSWMLASDQIKLAEAFNSRLEGGVADPTRRIHQYVLNNFRKIRNDGFSETPLAALTGLGEYSMYYSHYDYDQGAATFPENEAWDVEGANPATPSNQFVFGTDGGSLLGEGDTLSQYGLLASTATDVQRWELAKYQRGAIDPITGNSFTPMFELAQSHSMQVNFGWSNHGKSYGGFQPVPEFGGKYCEDKMQGIPSWQLKFTNLDTAVATTFTGICGPAYGGSDTDVLGMWEGPYAWYVFLWNGSSYRFDKKEYIEGPYTGGGVLNKPNGGQIERLMINPFLSEWKGDVAQQAEQHLSISRSYYNVMESAFNYDDFLMGQYQLSPAYATTILGELDVTYPSYTFLPVGLTLASGSASGIHTIPSGFTLGGRLVTQSQLTGSCVIGQFENGLLTDSISLDGTTSSICLTFQSKSCATVQYKMLSDATFSAGGGYIKVEVSDLWIYRPEIWDAYAVVRMSSGNAVDVDVMDERGTKAIYSKDLWDNYRHYGGVINIHNNAAITQQLNAVNTNPVWDASRRYCQSFTRVVHGVDIGMPVRKLVKGYEVSQSIDGVSGSYYTGSHSILYLSRHLASGDGWIDMFPGIVDSAIPTNNGIKLNAPTGSYSNEWLMFMCTKPYKNDENSIFKPRVYANNYPYINRCHFYAPYDEISKLTNPDLFSFFQEIPDNMLDDEMSSATYRTNLIIPESLPGYNYAHSDAHRLVNKPNTEDPVAAANFYQSCQVYPADYKIQSATVEDWTGEEVVKLVFTHRFQCTLSASLPIPLNSALWDRNALQGEPYRTDENAIRAFIIQQDGVYNDLSKPGDQAANSVIQLYDINPFGSIFPTFFFTKEIPKPYLSNTPLESSCSACTDSTRCYPRAADVMLMETYLRCICEGFIDETTSTNYSCLTDFTTAYDYTYENLIFDATRYFIGGPRKWISMFNYTDRDDKPVSYGPLPTVRVNAQTLLTISRAVNLLTKARLILPFALYTKDYQYRGDGYFSLPDAKDCCTTVAERKGLHISAMSGPAATTLISAGAWVDIATYGAAGLRNKTALNWDTEDACDELCNFHLYTTRQVSYYQFQLVDPISINAVPFALRDLLTTAGRAGFFGYYRIYEQTYSVEETLDPDEAYECQDVKIFNAESGYYKAIANFSDTGNICGFFYSGVVDSGEYAPASSVIAASKYKGGATYPVQCCEGGIRDKELHVRNTRDIILNIPLI